MPMMCQTCALRLDPALRSQDKGPNLGICWLLTQVMKPDDISSMTRILEIDHPDLKGTFR
jgi:hypothetical protein